MLEERFVILIVAEWDKAYCSKAGSEGFLGVTNARGTWLFWHTHDTFNVAWPILVDWHVSASGYLYREV